MKNKIIIISIPVAVVLLAFAYYTISPLFINVKADDALPAASQTQTQTQIPTQTLTIEQQQPQPTLAQVIGTRGHPASGTARIVEADGKKYVRYENFKTINGPDLYVYLAKDLAAKEFVSLGKVKATEGNINYEIPSGVDVTAYPYALTWCNTFGVLFNSADLQAR